MEVLQQEQGKEGVFYIEEGGETVAEMTYVHQGSHRIIIDHTEVSDSLKGTGAGMLLLDKAVEYARANSLKIVPQCPYVKHQFDKNPEKYAAITAY